MFFSEAESVSEKRKRGCRYEGDIKERGRRYEVLRGEKEREREGGSERCYIVCRGKFTMHL